MRTPLKTEDGSLTLQDPETGEWYHNRAGAWTEAVENYLKPSGALQLVQEKGTLQVLDSFFGLGYNTWALWQAVLEAPLAAFTVTTVGIDTDDDLPRFFPRVFEDPRLRDLKPILTPFEHNTYYQTFPGHLITIPAAEGKRFELLLLRGDVRAVVPRLSGPFDRVFHDPFSPARVPQLWTVELFAEYARLLAPAAGCLLTYSVAAAVRGGLREAGFHLARTPGVGRKTGGTLASVAPCPLGPSVLPLTSDELTVLASRSGLPYRDPTRAAGREAVLQARAEALAASARPLRQASGVSRM